MRILLSLLVIAALSGCASQWHSGVEDVRSTKYLAMDGHRVGSGKVFIATESWKNKAHPSRQDLEIIQAVTPKLLKSGYELVGRAGDADYMLICLAKVERAGSSISSHGGVISEQQHIKHIAMVFFSEAENGIPKNKLWDAINVEVWGHTGISSDRMFRIIMEKFPN